jgi:hypothetical protein
MPKTLIGAKPELITDLKDLLQKAAYGAFMTTNMPEGEEAAVSSFVTQATMDAAQKFSDRFAELACMPMADAIYKFVKEIAITLVPQGTLVAPPTGGPVTGTALPNQFTVT